MAILLHNVVYFTLDFCDLLLIGARVSEFPTQALSPTKKPLVRLWACGCGDVLAAIFTLFQPEGGGGQIVPSKYWCPHQVLKATDAPEGWADWMT